MSQGSSGHGAILIYLFKEYWYQRRHPLRIDSKKYAIHCTCMYFYAICVLFQGLSYLIVLKEEGDHGADM